MSMRTGLIFKENENNSSRRRKGKLFDMIIPIGASLTFVLLMIYFWLRGYHSFEMPSVLLIPIFVIFFNSFSVFSYLQMKKIRPLRIYDWGIISPEPDILSLKKIPFHMIDKVAINQYFRYLPIFMNIYKKNGDTITIGRLNEDDIPMIINIFEERGIQIEMKI
ncbi:MAG: hypothetical protein R6V50_00660 [Thermoplasmatota archaeon]